MRTGSAEMTSYRDAASYLEEIPKFTKKTELSHTRRILERLGGPDDSLRFIHVAGTNGKGSVCAFLDAAFREAGYHTAMFTSPHLVRVNERFRIDGQDVSDDRFAAAFDEVMRAVRSLQAEDAAFEHPTYFETLFLMGMILFHDARPAPDVVILETGMGGRLDATNVIRHPALCVITSISLDHTQYLGSTIPGIAGEKAGIIKPGVPVIYDAGRSDASEVICARAAAVNSPAFPVSPDDIREIRLDERGTAFAVGGQIFHETVLFIPEIAEYQMMNAALAYTALQVWNRTQHGAEVSPEAVRSGFAKMTWPCRMETVLPRVVVDGAHNPDGVAQFIRTVQRFHRTAEITLLFGAVSDKNYDAMIREMAEGIRPERVVTTKIAGKREASEEIFAALFRQYGVKEVFSDPSPARAFEIAEALAGDGMLFCAGSLYLAGEIREEAMKIREKSRGNQR